MSTTTIHACGTHNPYRLTCDQYDTLVATAAGRCQRCSEPTERLLIDHDHTGGVAAVRGLVCSRCNTRLGRVDALREVRDELDDAYLAAAWHRRRRVHYVASGSTKIRTVRVDDELWEAAQAKAKARRESVADVIRRALLDYVGGQASVDGSP